jgi:hypothetical protein
MTKSKYEFHQEASLSQKLADQYPLFTMLAGTDREISDRIATLAFLKEEKMIEGDVFEFVLGLLNNLRMSAFATSERTNEITKMGMQLPKAEFVISKFGE